MQSQRCNHSWREGSRTGRIAFCILAIGVLASMTPAEASPLRRTPIVAAVQNAAPSVVSIHGRKMLMSPDHYAPTDTGKEVKGMGTGVVIDPRGYIITNFHVVDGVERIHVTLEDRRTTVARLIERDPTTDLAVIKIDMPDPLPVIPTGTSADLMCGETVIAIGNAYGYEFTVTRGIVSALHRTVQVSDEQQYRDLIQTDASINPGNSGGPLLNIDGEMIGINVAVRVGAQGIGFAIPIDEALDVAARLIEAERLEGIAHGISGRTVREGIEAKFVVTDVREGSPAVQHGVQAGDVVKSVAGTPVHTALEFERAMLSRKAGEELEIVVERGSSKLTSSLALESMPVAERTVTDRAWEMLGLRLVPLPTRSIRQVSTRYQGGLRVVAVRNRSVAEEQGIRPGDILVGIHKWETVKMDDVAYILETPELTRADEQPVRFFILRGSDTLYGHFRVASQRR
ncbi:MAG: trypsin-like peptidase domain-containing protein [Pirellulaceae bacterium]|nr:trypsin-like peptidase domain-containing protein [Planctomycetales bacterium]MCA9163056.1 trypsin-like peptidase domain-containing protein [Planctomycetales bacterium]MCA9206979.1 trypsin-like peptidase domain-containing protein [Planctomycetales bacterium]